MFAERYARHRDRLSPAFGRVAAFIDANRLDVMTSSALDLARAIGTSDATVVRAVQALGFQGLHDLRTELAASYGGRNAPADNLTRTWADVGESAEAAMDDVLDSLAGALDSLRAGAVRRAMPEALKSCMSRTASSSSASAPPPTSPPISRPGCAARAAGRWFLTAREGSLPTSCWSWRRETRS